LNQAIEKLVSKGERLALSSEIWRCATVTSKCGIVLILNPNLTGENAEKICGIFSGNRWEMSGKWGENRGAISKIDRPICALFEWGILEVLFFLFLGLLSA
jgi:hypothetical protein